MKKCFSFLLCLILVISFALSGSIANAENSLTNEMPEGAATTPYVAVYLKELEKEVNLQSLSAPNQTVVDQYVVRVLDDYYKKDVALIDYLKKYTKDDELFSQIISPDRTEKIKSMHSLAEIYTTDITSECRSLILKYFWRYAIGSEDAEAITFFNNICTANTSPSTYMDYTEQQQGSAALSVTGTEYYNENFDSAAAAKWAYDNWSSSEHESLRDPNFPYFPDGNCTNFVSQALYQGGMLMHEEWYCYKKAGVGTLTVDQQAINENEFDQIDLYWDIEDPSPWISAYEFSEFWFDKCENLFNTDKAGYLANRETIFSNSIYPGDVVVLYNYNAAWIPIASHVMIITQRDYTNKDFLLAANTKDRQVHPLAIAVTTFDAVAFFCL